MNIWDIPIYNPTFASNLVNLSVGKVKRWLQGYDFTYYSGSNGKLKYSQKGPVVSRNKSDLPTFASFLDLIDLLFVKQFLKYGISLQKIRRALDEAELLLGGHHFAQRNFFTDGRNIYLQTQEKADALLELLSGGQWVIAHFIKELALQIDFDEPTGFAERWFPFGPKGLVVLDPRISFGKPIILGKNISTENIYDFYLGENEDTSHVCNWLNLKPEEVRAAISFETRIKAA